MNCSCDRAHHGVVESVGPGPLGIYVVIGIMFLIALPFVLLRGLGFVIEAFSDQRLLRRLRDHPDYCPGSAKGRRTAPGRHPVCPFCEQEVPTRFMERDGEHFTVWLPHLRPHDDGPRN